MKRRLRLVHLVQGLDIGGLEQTVASLVLSLDPISFQSRVVCYDALGSLVPRLEQSGVEVRLLKRKPGVDLGYVARLASCLLRQHVDLLHLHNPTAFFYGALAGRLARVPAIVYTDHGRDLESSQRNRLFHWLLSRMVDQVVAVSESARQQLVECEGVPAARVMVIHNGIDAERFARRDRRNEVRTSLGLRDGRPTIGVVARLDRVKNHALLLRAMTRIVECLPAAILLIIGDGPLRSELESLAIEFGVHEHVAFLGARDDVPDLLSALDLIVLPSVSEGLSLTLIEACAAGKAIVATDVGGNREVIEHGVNGLLVSSDDEEALASAAIGVLTDATRAATMGAAARRRSEAEFSLDTMVAQYVALYGHLLGFGVVAAAT